MDELRLLDEATRKASRDIDEMIAVLDAGAARSKRFFAALEKVRRESAK